jgi:hypothetical protein
MTHWYGQRVGTDTAQAAAQAKGRERYEWFGEALGRRLARGRHLPMNS